jgi:poly(A) polymerase
MSPSAPDALSPALEATSGLARLFAGAGHRLYLVGGVVREALAGRFLTGADLDCTTDARPRDVRRIVDGVATSVWTQGERFGTIGCVVDGQAFEITTHRAERYDPHSRKPAVTFGDDVEQDLARRDFTVNAMAVDAVDGRLLDPHGGRQDLAARLLRTPLDPAISFGDDPLRMLRAARFIASHGLMPDDAVVEAVRNMGERLQIVAVERVRDEFEKMLLLEDPSDGFGFLFHTGLIEQILADIAHHDPVEIGRVASAVAMEPASRWASLFVRHAAETAAACLRRLRSSTALVSAASGLVEARFELTGADCSPEEVRRFVYRCRVPVDVAVAFARAVAIALGQPRAGLDSFAATLSELRRIEDVERPVLPLDGDEVMATLDLTPGPAVGQALAFLQELTFQRGPIDKVEATEALRRWQASDYCSGA